jgi:hypothetical protein
MPHLINGPGDEVDDEFNLVANWITSEDRTSRVGFAIRLAIDWVIDGARTHRYSIDQLQTSEKVYIGNRVEHELLHQWELEKEGLLDTHIEGIAVDVKFSIGKSWMIPPEAVGHLCIIVSANDERSVFCLGLFRVRQSHLGSGKGNRDGKRSINKLGKQAIRWLVVDHSLPRNFLLQLDAGVRDNIFSHRSGQARVTELFRTVQRIPVPTTAIDTLAVQRDPSKRIRDARKALKSEGIKVLGWRYDRARILEWGLPSLDDDDWVSVSE